MPENLDWCNIFLALAGKTCYYSACKFQFTYIPFLSANFHISRDKWIFSLAVTTMAMLIASPVALLFDKVAPNKALGWGLAIPFLSMFLLPLGIHEFRIHSYIWIIANGAALGFGKGLWGTILGGIIGDFTEEKIRGRAFGIVEFSYCLSDFCIALIGISLQYWPVNNVYYVQGVIAFIVAMCMLWRYPRSAKRAVSSRVSEDVDSDISVPSTILSTVARLDQCVPFSWHSLPAAGSQSQELSYKPVENSQGSSTQKISMKCLHTQGSYKDSEKTSVRYIHAQVSFEDYQKTSMRYLLCKPSSIGTILLAFLSHSLMITFAYYVIWLVDEQGFPPAEVGTSYLISKAIPGIIVLIYSIFFIDRVGLIKSAYLSVLIFVLPIGLIFTFLNKFISITCSIWLIGLYTFGTEGMFVSIMGYITTAEFSPNPLFITAIWQTASFLGIVFWTSIGPSLWSSYGKLLNPGALTNQFGLLVATTTFSFGLGIVCLTIGRKCEQRDRNEE